MESNRFMQSCSMQELLVSSLRTFVKEEVEKILSEQQREKPFDATTPAEVKIINRDELCKRLSITEPTCIRWEKKGKIPSFRIGSNVRYNWFAVIETLEKNGGSKR